MISVKKRQRKLKEISISASVRSQQPKRPRKVKENQFITPGDNGRIRTHDEQEADLPIRKLDICKCRAESGEAHRLLTALGLLNLGSWVSSDDAEYCLSYETINTLPS